MRSSSDEKRLVGAALAETLNPFPSAGDGVYWNTAAGVPNPVVFPDSGTIREFS